MKIQIFKAFKAGVCDGDYSKTYCITNCSSNPGKMTVFKSLCLLILVTMVDILFTCSRFSVINDSEIFIIVIINNSII